MYDPFDDENDYGYTPEERRLYLATWATALCIVFSCLCFAFILAATQ